MGLEAAGKATPAVLFTASVLPFPKFWICFWGGLTGCKEGQLGAGTAQKDSGALRGKVWLVGRKMRGLTKLEKVLTKNAAYQEVQQNHKTCHLGSPSVQTPAH